jgi:hypothetical protein
MSARAKLLPVAFALGMAGTAAAQEDATPDLSFLEYLGSWQEGDEEWLVVAELEEKDREDEVAVAEEQTTDEQAADEGAVAVEEPDRLEAREEPEEAEPIDETHETDEN